LHRLLFLWLGLLPLILPLAFAGAQSLEPGSRLSLSPGDLPPPGTSPSAANPPRSLARPAGALPRVPAGFRVSLFAEGLEHARWLAVASNGDVLLAEPGAGKITLLRDGDGDGRADLRRTLAEGFDWPHGIVIEAETLLVSDRKAIWALPYRPGELAAGPARALTPPGALGEGSGHRSRTLAASPDGRWLFVGIGSRSNLDEEEEPRATIKIFPREGRQGRVFASGLRNPVGLAFQPGTLELWTVVNERDGMGDELVPDYLTRVEEGAFYGWPYAYVGDHPQPGFAPRRPDLVARTRLPELLFQSHSAPLGLVFQQSQSFPQAWRGDAFVALHGSWNAAKPRGYLVARVPFRDGRPEGSYEVFLSGFAETAADARTRGRAEVWGRPVGLAFAKDGSLLVADDLGQRIWRVEAGSP